MSSTAQLRELPYQRDSCAIFERIRDLPCPALLDSAFPHAGRGRFDIIVANPLTNTPRLIGPQTTQSLTNWFAELSSFHRDQWAELQMPAEEIPFCGGLLGYLGYDLGLPLNHVTAAPDTVLLNMPARLEAYEWAIIQDHLLEKAVLVTLPSVAAKDRNDLLWRMRGLAPSTTSIFTLQQPFSSNLSPEQYQRAFNRIQTYIRAGDCYQVNLAQRFRAPYEGDPWCAYQQLRSVAAAPWSAYMDYGEEVVLSLSPERFLRVQGQHVETSPIKGTRPRHADPKADALAISDLRSSDKDRAENLMIVDLLRNDLGKNCVPGSIHVDQLFELQSFATVHHLVSTISGELQRDLGPFELLRDSFPGGSITGAPKRRAMEIIDELEADARRLFCGSVLYVSADGRMDSNIAIRSLLCQQGQIDCWAGGAIVADSDWQQEYQETFDKVGAFLNTLEQHSGI